MTYAPSVYNKPVLPFTEILIGSQALLTSALSSKSINPENLFRVQPNTVHYPPVSYFLEIEISISNFRVDHLYPASLSLTFAILTSVTLESDCVSFHLNLRMLRRWDIVLR